MCRGPGVEIFPGRKKNFEERAQPKRAESRFVLRACLQHSADGLEIHQSQRIT